MNPVHLQATRILDLASPAVQKLASGLPALEGQAFLQAAHQQIVQQVRPIYTVQEWQPASVTLQKGRGSCSQRMACLEACARLHGIPTRVRALWVDGRFWHGRFPHTRWAIPRRILLAWPQFQLATGWLDLDELYSSIPDVLQREAPVFDNQGETLFEALQHANVDFLGKGCAAGLCSLEGSLARFVLADGGFFDRRDDLFRQLGAFQFSWKGQLFEWFYGNRSSWSPGG